MLFFAYTNSLFKINLINNKQHKMILSFRFFLNVRYLIFSVIFEFRSCRPLSPFIDYQRQIQK